MSEKITLKVALRDDIGKGASRRLRHAQHVPAIIYGDKKAATPVIIESRLIKRALENEAFYSQIITLDVDGKKEDVILKDLQRHPAKNHAMHLDFLRISATQPVTTNIPLHFINENICVGVKAGGILSHNITEVEIRCLPAVLPEFIEVDVAKLETNQTIHLADLNVSDKIEITQLRLGENHNLPVVSVKPPKKAADTTDDAEKTAEAESGNKETPASE